MSVLQDKSDARILDATAGNRKVWETRESPNIIWIDIEPNLERKPDLVMDCTQTKFPDKFLFMIVFDPPHYWGDVPGENFYSCRNLEEYQKFIDKYNFRRRGIPSYYGTDKFSSKRELLGFLHKAQKEFSRILSDNGVLWLNWSEIKIPLSKILPFFKNWDEMLRLEIGNKRQTLSEHQNYWIMFMKKDRLSPQFELTDFCEDTDKEGKI